MTISWGELEGTALSGQINLLRWVGRDEDGVFFTASYGPDERPVLIKLVPEVLPAGDAPLARWRSTAQLAHPNLLLLLDCGRTTVHGAPFLYAAFEAPDDRLATALESGPVTAAEARDIIGALLSALRFVHEQGLVHGAVDADHIVAVGERIKLTSDCLRAPGDGATPDDDIRGVGETLYRVLTGRHIVRGAPVDLSGLTGPWSEIVRHAVSPDPRMRWTLAQIAAALSGPARAPSKSAPARRPKPFPKWIYAVYVAVAITGIYWINHNAGPLTPPPPATAPAPAAAPPATQPARRPEADVATRGAEVRATAPPAAKPHTAETPAPARLPGPASTVPKAAAKTQSPAAPGGPRIWRVIAFTYSGRAPAEKKARTINARYPDFHAEVFNPGRMYLVALGGRMTREDAVRLQNDARAAGLPNDVYIQNYSQ